MRATISPLPNGLLPCFDFGEFAGSLLIDHVDVPVGAPLSAAVASPRRGPRRDEALAVVWLDHGDRIFSKCRLRWR